MMRCFSRPMLIGFNYRNEILVRDYSQNSKIYGSSVREINKNSTQRIQTLPILTNKLDCLISLYRKYGYLGAHLDPLNLTDPVEQLFFLNPNEYGLSLSDECSHTLDLFFPTELIKNVGQLLNSLKQIWSGYASLEFNHIQSFSEKEWLISNWEKALSFHLSNEQLKEIANEMIKSQVFDNFLANKFTTVKRYGCEGAESMMAFFLSLFKNASQEGIKEIIMCMPHRGRLNLLTGLLKFPPYLMFSKMKGMSELPLNSKGSGDVLSHLTTSVNLKIGDNNLYINLLPNPSHLEAVNPVCMGKVRGRQQSLQEGIYSKNEDSKQGDLVLCLQIHGDAAFAAQGIIQESLLLSDLCHFTVGGSLHLIVNNQLGFTTSADYGRSTVYCTDIAKAYDIPVIHVNADHPDVLYKVTLFACSYRQKFRKDIFIDLICFRRWGHNELDDPTFTNPVMYQKIHDRDSIPNTFCDKLLKNNIISSEEIKNIMNDYLFFLNNEFQKINTYKPSTLQFKGKWKEFVQAPSSVVVWDTGFDSNLLKYIGYQSVSYPKEFKIHPHLQKFHVESRKMKLETAVSLDWATAEAMAIGSLLYEGISVRLCGQDTGRGTFSHRHLILVDQQTNNFYVPLNMLHSQQSAFLEIINSPLSEEAVLAFEYGMSIESPFRLVIWEAQFGDFFNGAQIIIDTFIASGESKWLLQSGLVLLLPHGYDGAGPEHSSCRVERFLQLCDSSENHPDGDDVNIHITHPTNPAQYFHLIRRQIVRNYRKPLIVVAPKLLLRHPQAISPLQQMAPGNIFYPVLGDKNIDPVKVSTVVFCSGKHFYLLCKERKLRKIETIAIIRLEQLSPFPMREITQELSKYLNVEKFIWSQEEHQNMGAWSFVKPRFENLLGIQLKYAGRKPLAAPAVGIGVVHQNETIELLNQTFNYF